MTISKRLRYEILRRDNHQCRYCGATAPSTPLTVDHVIPTALGGTDDPGNLVAACEPCNAGKTSTQPDGPLVDQVDEDMIRWRDAMQVMADVDANNRAERNSRRENFRVEWESWTYAYSGQQHTFDLPVSWTASLDNLYAAGITWPDVVDAVDEAMRRDRIRDRFAYFCGVCWTTVRRRQQWAAEYLAAIDAAEAGGLA